MERCTIDFPSVDHSDVSLREGPEVTRAAVANAMRLLEVATERDAIVAWLMVAGFGGGLVGDAYTPTRRALVALASWMRETRAGQAVFWFTLGMLQPDSMPRWASRLLEAEPSALLSAYGCAFLAPEPQPTENLSAARQLPRSDPGRYDLGTAGARAERSRPAGRVDPHVPAEVGASTDAIVNAELEARLMMIRYRHRWGLTNDEIREMIREVRRMRKTGTY